MAIKLALLKALRLLRNDQWELLNIINSKKQLKYFGKNADSKLLFDLVYGEEYNGFKGKDNTGSDRTD